MLLDKLLPTRFALARIGAGALIAAGSLCLLRSLSGSYAVPWCQRAWSRSRVVFRPVGR